ncbi:hypothetical protein Dimus_003219 [Dionaea muscipula]
MEKHINLIYGNTGLPVFDTVEGFNKALSLDGSWWISRGLKIIPWSYDLVIKPVREFDPIESGSINEGRIQILTEVDAPFNFVFMLRVDGRVTAQAPGTFEMSSTVDGDRTEGLPSLLLTPSEESCHDGHPDIPLCSAGDGLETV